MLPARDSFRFQDTHRLKVKGWKKVFHTNGNQKGAGGAILILDKIDSEWMKEEKLDKYSFK